MVGGLVVLWKPNSICLSGWRTNHFSLITTFTVLETGAKGTLVNVYGTSSFPHKTAFLNFLTWMKVQASEGSSIIRGNFNLITSLKEDKGGMRDLDRFQEAFRDYMVHIPFKDIETENGW